MVYLEFNPRDYEKYYKFAQPEGNLVFRDLDPKVQAKMLRLLMDRKNEYIGESIWCSAKGGSAAAKITAPEGCTTIGGENAGGPMKYFDGAIKRILANTATNATEVEKAGGQVIIAGTTELSTGANVEAALNAMWKKCPKQIRKKASHIACHRTLLPDKLPKRRNSVCRQRADTLHVPAMVYQPDELFLPEYRRYGRRHLPQRTRQGAGARLSVHQFHGSRTV